MEVRKTLIAGLAQQSSKALAACLVTRTARVIMIDGKFPITIRATADCTTITLSFKNFVVSLYGNTLTSALGLLGVRLLPIQRHALPLINTLAITALPSTAISTGSARIPVEHGDWLVNLASITDHAEGYHAIKV